MLTPASSARARRRCCIAASAAASSARLLTPMHLALRRRPTMAQSHAIGLRECRNVGQIVFLLRIVVLELRRPAEEISSHPPPRCRHCRDRPCARPSFASELDNAVEHSVRVRDHPAIGRALRVERDDAPGRSFARGERRREASPPSSAACRHSRSPASPSKSASAGARGRGGMAGAELPVLDRRSRRPGPRHRRARRRASGAVTTTMRATPAPRAAAITWPRIGRPATLCSTLGIADFIRVPMPAARMTAALVMALP